MKSKVSFWEATKWWLQIQLITAIPTLLIVGLIHSFNLTFFMESSFLKMIGYVASGIWVIYIFKVNLESFLSNRVLGSFSEETNKDN